VGLLDDDGAGAEFQRCCLLFACRRYVSTGGPLIPEYPTFLVETCHVFLLDTYDDLSPGPYPSHLPSCSFLLILGEFGKHHEILRRDKNFNPLLLLQLLQHFHSFNIFSLALLCICTSSSSVHDNMSSMIFGPLLETPTNKI
jgi:hypothetical protein